MLCASSVFAQSPATTAPSAAANPAAADPGEFIEQPVGAGAATPSSSAGGASPFGFLNTASRSANLLGDMWGLRPMLSKYGVTLSITETSEILGNVSGGTRQGFDYDGLTTATAQMDTQRAFGLYGGLFNVSALQIHAAT